MREAVVIALSVGGRGKVFKSGQIVKETNFPPDHFDSLIKRGFIRELGTKVAEPEKAVVNITPTPEAETELKEPKFSFESKKSKKK